MKAEFVARTSAWAGVKIGYILLFFLIVPIVIMIFKIMAAKEYRLEFYQNKVIEHKGWLSTSTRTITFNGILSTDLKQSFWGTIWDYGTVIVDAVGKWDVETTHIKYPEKLEAYLQTRVVSMNVQDMQMYTHMTL